MMKLAFLSSVESVLNVCAIDYMYGCSEVLRHPLVCFVVGEFFSTCSQDLPYRFEFGVFYCPAIVPWTEHLFTESSYGIKFYVSHWQVILATCFVILNTKLCLL